MMLRHFIDVDPDLKEQLRGAKFWAHSVCEKAEETQSLVKANGHALEKARKIKKETRR